MNFTYENQGTNTYLVYTVSAEESMDSMSLGMLTNNKIPGLATTLFTQMDATKYIKYNVSAHIPVSQFFAGAVNKKRLLGVFRGIVSAILSAEDYMIDEGSILLDLDYIFADVTTCETVLICLPVEKETHRHDLGAFFKGIMFSTQFDQTENCDHVAKIINYLNSSPLFSLNDFRELLDKIEEETVAEPVPEKEMAQPVVVASVEEKIAVQPQAPVQVVAQTTVTAKTPEVPVNKTPVQIPSQEKKTAPVAPVVQRTNDEAKSKGFSLFGFLSSKNDKKEVKAPKPVKQTVMQTPAAAFEVPGQAAQKTPFEVPGRTPAPQVRVEETTREAGTVQQITQPKPMVSAQPVIEKTVVQQPVQSAVQPTVKSLSFGETTVLGGSIGETTVLGEAKGTVKTEPHIVRLKTNEVIPLNKPVFRIGKERSYVDYFISDNTAVSRSHANIVNHNGEFFVVDTNSTNHTYVNGGMIQSGVETKLSHGTTIRLANEEFEFKMY